MTGTYQKAHLIQDLGGERWYFRLARALPDGAWALEEAQRHGTLEERAAEQYLRANRNLRPGVLGAPDAESQWRAG